MIVANFKTDTALGEFVKEMKEKQDRGRERAEFLKKQAKELQVYGKEINKEFWAKVEKHLEDSKLLPATYDKHKHALDVDEETGDITMQTIEQVTAMMLMEKMKGLPPSLVQALTSGNFKMAEFGLDGED